MARYFKLIKHKYYTDDNREVLRGQRVYVKNSDITVQLSPITPLLLFLEIQTNLKIDKPSRANRKLETVVNNDENESGYSVFSINLPYNPSDTRLEMHIKEILSYNGVLCGDYIGDNNV